MTQDQYNSLLLVLKLLYAVFTLRLMRKLGVLKRHSVITEYGVF